MKIKTQFIITMLLFGIILIVLAVSAIITSQQVGRVSEQENIASSIAQAASELSYLSNDYLIYRESQQLTRWQSRFASFSSQVARLNVDKPEQQALVRNIRANEERMRQVFESVASTVGSPSPNRSTALDLAFFQVSWSRMAVQSQALVSDASRLTRLLDRRVDQLTGIRTMLIYLMVGLLGLFLLASYMLTYRRILKSITRLQAGTAVIGAGNLHFKIEEKKNDEIGDLAHAFNRMTTNLKDVTASKEELEWEIVGREKAEEELRRQREWLGITLSSIGDAVIATDKQGRVTLLNPVAETLTGWQSEEALNQPVNSVFRIINEKTHEPAVDLVAQVLSRKCVVGLANDTALVTKDNREIPIEDSAAPILDSTGNIIGVVLVFHDVTQKRHAQAALREAHDRAAWLARFPEQNPNPVMRASSDGTVLYCNPASARFPGWRREVGQGLQNELLPLFDRAMEEGKELQWDVEIEGRIYFVWIAPVVAERYANIYARDITERKRAEEALQRRSSELQKLAESLEQRVRERTAELEEANKSLRQLSIRLLSAQEEERKRVAGEIHDSMGSCLSGIKFKVESAIEEIAKTPKTAPKSLNSIVPVIQEAIEECRRIQMDLRPSMLDDLGLLPTLSWFFRRFQTIYSAIHVEQEVTIEESELPNSLKIVIYRVIQEAMNNTAKHSKADLVRVSLRKVHDKMELSVKDNGCGFSVQQRLFLEASKRGLGLTSMRERTELSGGSFAMESAEGMGTTICASWTIN